MHLLPKLTQLFDKLNDTDFKDLQVNMDCEAELRQYQSTITTFTVDEKRQLCDSIYTHLAEYKLESQIYIVSFLAHIAPNIKYTRDLLRLCQNDEVFTPETQFYFYYQITHKRFVQAYRFDSAASFILSRFYKHIYLRYKSSITDEMCWIPPEERNKNFIVVMTSQFISITHGPTKTALDRCRVLQEHMHKQIILINTSEALAYTDYRPFFNFILPNYAQDCLNTQHIEYENATYRYFQYDATTPCISSITDILAFIRKNKPYCIFTIGGNSIMSDMCSNLVPTISISLAPSDLTTTEGTFQVIGRKITDEDITLIQKLGKDKEHILSSIFTSSFKAQTKHLTRSELNLPEDACLALVVGGRLQDEIQDDFFNMMIPTIRYNVFYVFAGCFDSYEKYMNKYPVLQSSCAFIGFAEDILAVNECCDIYVNPKRIGGGTSVAEALHMGLPVVTFHYGDGGLGAGEEFHVSDYDEMTQVIIQYATDKEFYAAMSEKATARAAVLTDSVSAFSGILPAIEHSPLFINPPKA